jgi:hypothetical protein
MVATSVALVGNGCDAQVGIDFRGPPLAVVRGEIVGEADDLPRALGIALLWETSEHGAMPGTVIPVEPILPASFEMALYAAPPAAVQNAQTVGDDEAGAFSADAVFAVVDLDLLPDVPAPLGDVAGAVLATTDRTNEQFTIVWADRAFDSNGLAIAAGYSVWREFATGNCPSDPRVVECLERATAGGASPAEAHHACVQFDIEAELIKFEDWRPRLTIASDGRFIPPWGNFAFCAEGRCPGGTCEVE